MTAVLGGSVISAILNPFQMNLYVRKLTYCHKRFENVFSVLTIYRLLRLVSFSSEALLSNEVGDSLMAPDNILVCFIYLLEILYYVQKMFCFHLLK